MPSERRDYQSDVHGSEAIRGVGFGLLFMAAGYLSIAAVTVAALLLT